MDDPTLSEWTQFPRRTVKPQSTKGTLANGTVVGAGVDTLRHMPGGRRGPNSPKTRPQLKERSCKRARRTACKDRAPPAHPRQASAVTEDCRLTAVFCVRQITQKAPASAYHRPPTWQAKNTTNQGRPLHPRSWGTSECPKTCCPLIEVDGSRSCAVQHMKDWR